MELCLNAKAATVMVRVETQMQPHLAILRETTENPVTTLGHRDINLITL